MPVTVTPLADFNDAVSWMAGAEILRNVTDPAAQTRLMTWATRSIENQCERRLAPFTGLTESQRATGVDTGILAGSDMPLDLTGALGRSQALAFASTNMVRDIWLREYAPVLQDQWSYTVTQIQLVRAYGDTELVNPSQIEGPEPDTGHLRFRLGTFIPEATTVRVTYDGGYQQVPDDLQLACIYRAFKFAVIGAEPETRKEMSTAELDAEVLTLIAPYIR